MYPQQAGKKGFKNGEWAVVGFIILGLGAVKKLLDPAKFVLELVVTSFFSYLFINLSQGKL